MHISVDCQGRLTLTVDHDGEFRIVSADPKHHTLLTDRQRDQNDDIVIVVTSVLTSTLK